MSDKPKKIGIQKLKGKDFEEHEYRGVLHDLKLRGVGNSLEQEGLCRLPVLENPGMKSNPNKGGCRGVQTTQQKTRTQQRQDHSLYCSGYPDRVQEAKSRERSEMKVG